MKKRQVKRKKGMLILKNKELITNFANLICNHGFLPSNYTNIKNALNNNKQATLELGTKPVGKLLTQYALPAIVAMSASSLYNTIDSIFIGKGVGALAISGLAITFPFMNLSGAFGAAVGVGSSTMISVRLGQKDYATALNIFGNCISLNVLIGLVFATVTLLFLDPILLFFGASEQTLPYAREYMQIILLGNVITHMYLGMNAVLRAASKPRQAMYATIFTVVLNTILDPLFIYVFHLGIRGAAFATVLAQFVAMCWQGFLFSDKQGIIHFERGIYKLKSNIVKNIVGIGLSPFLMNVTACLVVIVFNKSLYAYGGDLAVGAYGIVHRISFLFLMVVFGLNQGMQPIAGYNYGAMQFDRMMLVLKYTITAATIISILGWIVSEFMPYYCAILFTDDSHLIAFSERGLKVANLALPIVGFQIVVTNFFQSIGKAKISIFLSLSRQLLFLLPVLLILPRYMQLDGVWASFPISDTISSVVALAILIKYMRHFSKLHKQRNYA